MKIPEILLTIEAVLKGQGADPVVVANRKPGLLKIAQSALEIGQSLIHPDSFNRSLEIISFDDERMILEGGIYINSTHISETIAGCRGG